MCACESVRRCVMCWKQVYVQFVVYINARNTWKEEGYIVRTECQGRKEADKAKGSVDTKICIFFYLLASNSLRLSIQTNYSDIITSCSSNSPYLH